MIQTYLNNFDIFIEAQYYFPILINFCFFSFEVLFDDKAIKGLVKEKEEAKREYIENLDKINTVAYSEIN